MLGSLAFAPVLLFIQKWVQPLTYIYILSSARSTEPLKQQPFDSLHSRANVAEGVRKIVRDKARLQRIAELPIVEFFFQDLRDAVQKTFLADTSNVDSCLWTPIVNTTRGRRMRWIRRQRLAVTPRERV